MRETPVRISNVVVLGAGTMGAQVAAHLVAQGLEVTLLDVPGSPDRNALAKRGVDTLRKLKPSPLHLPEQAAALRTGNFEDDWGALAKADWVFEAIVEDLEIKKQVFTKVAAAVGKHTLITTNSSGLGVGAMSAHLAADVRRRFFGAHFFNPPRYLKLLEVIPGPETDPALISAFSAFGDRVLGKGVVLCKDTPNFIGNRIGSYGLCTVLRAMQDLDLTIEEVDTLTGPAIGRARSATFRTCDIAGVDVCVKVVDNLHAAVASDPERGVFVIPPFMKEMVARGWLGEKTGAGFYQKSGKEIRTLDWKTLEYRERQKAKLPSVDAAQSLPDPAARINQIMAGKDKAAQFLWRVLSSTSFYAAALLGEIADDVAAVDHAMEWGYGWGMGPFRAMDALGLPTLVERARAEERRIPPLIERMLAEGRNTFYGDGTMYGPTGPGPVTARPGVLELAAIKPAATRKKNPGASLIDLGDGVGLVEFHSKMNALGPDAVGLLTSTLKEGRANFDALVIGNQGENFSVGANLMMVVLAVQEEEWDELDASIRQFQNTNMALKYAELPVVVAPFGMALGGGCEIALHGARIRASAETYMGLVEVGVGLIPGAGGTKEMALRAHDRCLHVEGADPFPFIKRAFDAIGFGKVATSGAESLRLFGRDGDSLSPNPDRLIGDAREVALGLARAGWRAGRPRTDVPALGRPGLSTFIMGIHNARRAGQISEHDALVGTKVATILCGGDRAPGLVSEQHYLDLERESFLSLLGTKKTQERIQHMLKEGKPLRN